MVQDVLTGDEWIGFQTMEGPCSVGCDYCYEREKALNLLKEAHDKGKIKNFKPDLDNRQLATFIKENQSKLEAFFDIKEFEKYFRFLKEANINRAFLVGSEPTEHPKFEKILDVAEKNDVSLLIYTSGRNLSVLKHPAISHIVLHLASGNNTTSSLSDNYMDQVNNLLKEQKEIHFRVNFSNNDLREKELIFNFYDAINKMYRNKVLLKFSFTTKLCNIPNIQYFTPDSMREISDKIIGFIDEFKEKYPGTPVISERPLFRCAFDEGTWKKYQHKAGFTSKCDMEFVVYPENGLSLCPPARNLIKCRNVNSSEELVHTILELKERMKDISKKPSFDVCKNCRHRLDSSCQGGCFGYK